MLEPDYKLNNIEEIAGFAAENKAPNSEKIKVLQAYSVTSDDSVFHHYASSLLKTFKLHTENINSALILLHKDNTADIYLKPIPLIAKGTLKKNVQKGDALTVDDFVDLHTMSIDSKLPIRTDDKCVYLCRYEWKFGLFFNLTGKNLTKTYISKQLTNLYKKLWYAHIFEFKYNNELKLKLLNKGWFPFIEILGGDFKDLFYPEGLINFDAQTEKRVIEKFSETRIDHMSKKWWINEVLKEKRTLIQAGLNAFKQNNQDGNINCINTLTPQIEGILRLDYFQKTQKGDSVKVPQLLNHLFEKGKEKNEDLDYSLFLPVEFKEYCSKWFSRFSIENCDIPYSRHPLSHGVSSPSQYTRSRALQSILMIDQLRYFLNES